MWSNSDSGLGIAPMVHARLLRGRRVVTDAAAADLFFIPLDVVRTCDHYRYAPLADCGVSFEPFRRYSSLWAWLEGQPSWQRSDGRDHFVIASYTWPYIGPDTLAVRCPACDSSLPHLRSSLFCCALARSSCVAQAARRGAP